MKSKCIRKLSSASGSKESQCFAIWSCSPFGDMFLTVFCIKTFITVIHTHQLLLHVSVRSEVFTIFESKKVNYLVNVLHSWPYFVQLSVRAAARISVTIYS